MKKTTAFLAALAIAATVNIVVGARAAARTAQEISELRAGLARSGYASLRMGQVIAEPGGEFFIATLVFPGGFGAVSFATPDDALRFARLSCVAIEKKAAPVKVARSEVIVEAQE